MLYENLSRVGRHRLLSQERFRMQYVKAVMITEIGGTSTLDFSDHMLNKQVIL